MTNQQSERSVVRDLARKVIEIAHEPRMNAILKRWRDVNALRKPDRAPVYCRPVGCWREILTEDSLLCRDPWLRALERNFRQILYKRDVDDDTPVETYFTVTAQFDYSPANVWGVDTPRHESNVEGGAWGFDPPLKTDLDFEKLCQPSLTYNPHTTQTELDRHQDLLGDIAPVRLIANAPLTTTLGGPAASLRGLTEMMMDMAAQPELMHRLMAYLRDVTLKAMDQVEAIGLLTPNNTGPMTCSDPIGVPDAQGVYHYRNMWSMPNSQEFDQVSPADWQEFCLNYQKPILERFGLVGYGCCENLTRKIDGVLSIPNLRIFVCSAWTDLSTVLEKTGRRYCIMWRQKASDVVFTDDASRIKRDLFDGAKRLQGRYYQIVLRELETLAGHADRLHVWTRTAKDAAETYA